MNPQTPNSSPGDVYFSELLDDFYAESDDRLIEIRRNLLALEEQVDGHPDASVLQSLFRHFHTLKGLAGMVNIRPMEELAHHLEGYLKLIQQDYSRLNVEGVRGLSEGVQTLEQVIGAHHDGKPQPPVDAAISRLAVLTTGKPTQAMPQDPVKPGDFGPLPFEEQAHLDAALAGSGPARAWRFTFKPTPDLAEHDINVNVVRAELEKLGHILKALPQITDDGSLIFEFLVTSGEAPESFTRLEPMGLSFSPIDLEKPDSRDEGSSLPTYFSLSNIVRVDLDRIDNLMQIMSRLVIERSRMEEQVKVLRSSITTAQWRPLQESIRILERQMRDQRELVLGMRLVSIGDLFERMKFVARDLASKTGKKVVVDITGRETGIDKLVIERMLDPLLHLVRNAVSHGIETPEERIAAGKPPEGCVMLRAYTDGETVVIEVEDDGQGINQAEVTALARDRGLIDDDHELDNEELLDLLRQPGFTTRAGADRASGRGIGMDVVSSAVQDLDGTLAFQSEPGKGTRFTVLLPLTLSIIDAVIVTVGDHRFALPQLAITEIVEVRPRQITALEKGEIFEYRGRALPLIRLNQVFNLAQSNQREMQIVLVVNTRKGVVGVVVGRVQGIREIVHHALKDPLLQAPGLAGATELGDGRVVLILDVPGLVSLNHEQVNRNRIIGRKHDD